MQKISKYIFLSVLTLALSFFGSIANAQNTPPGPTQTDLENAQGQASAEANSRAEQEAAAARAQFENQFGAPPEAYQKHEPAKPQIEPPQRVPDEVKKYMSDTEIIPIYCAMVKWKTGQFFSAMNALKKNMVPAMEKAKDEVEIDIQLPDIDAIKSEGQKRVDAICGAKTLNDAENLTQDFATWGGEIDGKNITPFMNEFENKMKQKGDEIKQKIESAIQPIVDEEKPKIQAEIEAEAKSYASKIKFDHQPSAAEIANARNEIENYLKPIIENKKQQMVDRVTSKVNEIKDKEAGKLIDIGKLFEGIDQKINNDTEAGLSEFDGYKKEAFDLRKKAVFKILDKNLEEAMLKLDASEKDIEEARKSDPTIRSVSQIKDEIKQDRKNLEAKLDAALEAGNETAFQQALNDFKVKWETARAEGEKAAEQSVSKACDIALAQFTNGKTQININLQKINDLQTKCEGSTSEECLKIGEFSDRFSVLTSKMTDLKSGMDMAESMCKAPEKADRTNMIALLRKIQSDGEDLKVYGASLEAEKSKAIVDSADKICSQVLPQIEASKTEINNNDLLVLQNNLNKCSGKNTEECKIVNQLASKFNEFKKEAGDFSKQIISAENFCKDPKEGDIEKISEVLNTIKDTGDELKNTGKELQTEQAEKASEKALCRAIVPQMGAARSEISAGLNKISETQNCNDNSDKCSAIKTLQPKFTEITNKTTEIFSNIGKVNTMCENAGDSKPSDALTKSLNTLNDQKVAILDLIDKLKTEQEKTGNTGNGIKIEAESESSSSLLPHTENWHSRKETNPSWRPPFYGTGVWYLSRGGESLTYNFQAPSTGEYNLWVRDYVDNFQPIGVRRVTYTINGKILGTFPEVILPKSKIDPQKGAFGWHNVGKVRLSSGQNTMKTTKESTTSGAAILDAFYLTTGNEIPTEK